MKQSILLLAALALGACTRKPMQVVSIDTQAIPVDSSLNAIQDSDYIAYLEPIKQDMEAQLNIPLGYAPEEMVAMVPESKLLNWACDALYEMAIRNYEGRVDLAVVNAHGLRCDWSAGDITFRNVFELMPFDNELVILTLSGENLLLLAQNCVDEYGEGVSSAFRVVGVHNDKVSEVISVTLNGQPIDPAADYYVATSDYLSGGADGLSALPLFSERVMTGKKIRDLYIEYIQLLTAEGKNVESQLDGRMAVFADLGLKELVHD